MHDQIRDEIRRDFKRELGLLAMPRSSAKTEVIGYRCWKISDDGFLRSMHISTLWKPGEALTGRIDDELGVRVRGVHAYSGTDGLDYEIAWAHVHPIDTIVVGTVSLWGKVVICERGYRAEYGYPKQLCWTNAGEGVLQELARTYGCEVYQP